MQGLCISIQAVRWKHRNQVSVAPCPATFQAMELQDSWIRAQVDGGSQSIYTFTTSQKISINNGVMVRDFLLRFFCTSFSFYYAAIF